MSSSGPCGSVGWRIVLCTESSQVQFLVRAQMGVNQSMFLSLSLSQVNKCILPWGMKNKQKALYPHKICTKIFTVAQQVNHKLWYIHMLDYYSAIKRKKYWYMQQFEWISKVTCCVWVKPSLKKVHGFRLCDSFQKGEQICICQRSRIEGGYVYKNAVQGKFLV